MENPFLEKKLETIHYIHALSRTWWQIFIEKSVVKRIFQYSITTFICIHKIVCRI